MEMQRIIEMLATNQAKLDADREELKADREEMIARMDANTIAMLATKVKMNEFKEDMKTMQERALVERKSDIEEMKQEIRAGQEQIQENLRRMMEEMTNTNQAKTDAKLKELTETIEKTQMELQTAEVSLDARTRKLQEDLIETKHELQARLEAVETRTERGNTPAAGVSAAPPPTFNGSTSWSVFRRQFEIVAEHNRWSNWEKSTYLITALKGRAADVLPEIPTNTTYKNTLQALEDRFGDQHFAAAYRCQLTTRTQKAGESLQDFATAIELLAHRAYPTLPKTT
jgi:translation initiation factor 2B subunit (eIF-2B alpha/beta/delta family)